MLMLAVPEAAEDLAVVVQGALELKFSTPMHRVSRMSLQP
jgi:hypothetical protein